MAKNRIYLDHNATTPMRREVYEAMLPWLSDGFGNPSSIHAFGREARVAVEAAREEVAALINAEPEEIIFTSGATEADNLALKGLSERRDASARPRVVVSGVEHEAILKTGEYLRAYRGCDETVLPVDERGIPLPAALREAIADGADIVSVMHANNETGTLMPVEQIAELCRERGIPFHTDAAQSAGKITVNVKALGADMVSISGHKFYGPKGIGALWVRRGTKLVPQQHGGAHERGRRAGTENVAAIVGFGVACRLAGAELAQTGRHLAALRDELERRIVATIPGATVNGHPTERLPGTLNVSFDGVDGELLIQSLDLEGIAVSSGSACTSGSFRPSHVLRAMGRSGIEARRAVRFSFGRGNTPDEVDRVMEVLPGIVERMRRLARVEV